MTSPPWGGLSSIGPYSYRRASNRHGSAPLPYKQITTPLPRENRSVTSNSSKTVAIVTSSFAAVDQVWGKIGAINRNMDIFPRNISSRSPIVRPIRIDLDFVAIRIETGVLRRNEASSLDERNIKKHKDLRVEAENSVRPNRPDFLLAPALSDARRSYPVVRSRKINSHALTHKSAMTISASCTPTTQASLLIISAVS